MKIKKITNGYLVIIPAEEDDTLDSEIAFTYDTEDDEKKCITDLLYYITEQLGIFRDAYSTNNLNITWDKKGRKVD